MSCKKGHPLRNFSSVGCVVVFDSDSLLLPSNGFYAEIVLLLFIWAVMPLADGGSLIWNMVYFHGGCPQLL